METKEEFQIAVGALIPEDFREWLLKQSEDMEFITSDPCRCPIAAWLSDLFNESIGVSRCSITQLKRIQWWSVPAPSWISRFIQLYDRGRMKCGGKRHVLNVLDWSMQ